MVRTFFMIAILSVLAQAKADAPNERPLFELAVDYSTLERNPVCRRDAEGALYKRCYNARSVYQAASQRAEAENKPLMTIWGFDECSACQFLETREFNPDDPWKTDRFAQWALSPKQKAGLSNQGRDLKILLVRINSQSPSGQRLAEDLGILDLARERGGRRVWSPFITMTDTASGKIVSQASMRGGEQPCNRWDEFALNLEALGFIPSDPSYERRIC
ncbi:MAG: hypothetical protein AAGG45_02810 [Pseudomonadota bacterium]